MYFLEDKVSQLNDEVYFQHKKISFLKNNFQILKKNELMN